MATTRTASQNGRRSRAKGAAWEREVARVFAALYPGRDVRRCIAQARTAKREGCDVEGTPWWIETKCGAAIDLRAALEQAESDSDQARCELVIAKRDRAQPVVYARLSTLAGMLAPHVSFPANKGTAPVTMLLTDFVLMVGSAPRAST